MSKPTQILFVIVIAQFCGTSLWFAGNAALPQLIQHYQWNDSALGYLTSSVQLGFIAGTLIFALTGITDRFSPSRVFLVACLAGAATNLIALLNLSSFSLVLMSRLCVGIALAGIYPVGMKIAADWKDNGLGHWLGALVGALVLGTALPHLVKALPDIENTSGLLLAVSVLALFGGILMSVFVGDGPHRSRVSVFSFHKVTQAFQSSSFRKPAFGYFGHMWELYTFWAFVPFMISFYEKENASTFHPLWAFAIIGIGAVSCWWGGLWSRKVGSERVALYALIISFLCCLASPLSSSLPKPLYLLFLLIWSFAVIADSPQFSALIARYAKPDIRGSALTIVTCIGFSITIVSIQLLNFLSQQVGDSKYLFLVLAVGPAVGIYNMVRGTGLKSQ